VAQVAVGRRAGRADQERQAALAARLDLAVGRQEHLEAVLAPLERQEAQEHPAGAGPGWALAVEGVRLAGERLAAQQHQVAEAVRQAAERLSRQAAGWYPGVAALAAQVGSDQGGWARLGEELARLGEGQRQVVAAQVDQAALVAQVPLGEPYRWGPLNLAVVADPAMPPGQAELRQAAPPLDQLAARVQRLAQEVEEARQELDRQEAADPAGLARSGLAGVLVPRGAVHPGDFPVASHPAGESHLPVAERLAELGYQEPGPASLDQAVAALVALRQEEEAQREVRPVVPQDPLPAGLWRHHLAGLAVRDPRALIQGLPSGL
jgi:hypothetical protein